MDDSLVHREKELFKINENINASSPKLFNKNEVFAINNKSIKKPSLDEQHNEAKSTSITKTTPPEDTMSKNNFHRPLTRSAVPKIIEKQVINKENLIRFLKAKISILEQENEDKIELNDKLSSNLKTTAKEYQKVEHLLEQQKSTVLTLQQSNRLLEVKIQHQNDIIHDRDAKIAKLLSEKNEYSNDANKSKNCIKILEKRLQRALEDLNKMSEKLNQDLAAKKVKFKF